MWGSLEIWCTDFHIKQHKLIVEALNEKGNNRDYKKFLFIILNQKCFIPFLDLLRFHEHNWKIIHESGL